MSGKIFSGKRLIVTALVFLAIFCAFGYAAAGIFEARGKVFNSDGVTSLPGTGLADLVTANPLLPYGYVQCVYAGPDGAIDPPDTDGSPTNDDVLLVTAEFPGQLFTAVGEGFPFLPNGRFTEDFNHSLNVGSSIYSRVWNGTSPATSTHYGDSSLYSLVDSNFDGNDFGEWSTDIPISADMPEIEVTPLSLSLNYGDVFIGSDSSLTVTITNTGTVDLDVSSIDFGASTSADFAITAGPASIILAPGANTPVEVTYSPLDTGSDSGTLVIESNDADESTVTVSLSGNGVTVPVPEIDVTPLSLNYGDVFIGSSTPLSVTIANTGTADLDVSSIAFGAGTSADFAITSGSSNVLLTPGANTTVEVTYSPSDEGTDSGTLVIDSDDADEPTVTVSLSGNGVTVPVPEIDVTPLSLNYGDVFIGSSTPLSVTIANTGTADLDVSSIAFGAGTSADFAITSGSSNVLLTPGANTTVEVTYSPSDEGTDSGTLVIDSDDADEPTVTVSLSGNGVTVPVPEIDVTPLSLNYGDVFIGSSTPLSVTIANTGTADLDVSSIAFGAGTSADFAITSGSSNVLLTPGANTTVEVTYSPSDEGTDSGTLVIDSDDADEPTVTVSLSGNGVTVPVPEIDVTPLSLNYGDVFIGSSTPLSVTIANTGTADLDVSSIAFGAGTSADFAITSGSSNVLLTPGANTTVEVTYSPSDEGTDSGTLVIDSDDADEPTVTVSLSGNGVTVPVPEIDVTPLSLNYGDVFIGSSTPLSVTIANTGTADLDVSSIALGTGTSADFAITAGPASIILAPGANTTVEVTYSPSDEGTDSGTLEIVSDDADEPTVTVSLSGNGVAVPVPEIDVTPLSLNYGDVFIGSGTPLSVTITNTGTADLDVSSIALGAGTSADFAITAGPASIILAPGANTPVEVTYSPSDAGTDSGTLVIDSDDADEPTVTVSLSGNGVEVPVPEIEVTPLSLSLNYGDVFIGSDSSLTVTITNTGTADLDVSSIAFGAGTSADFAITAGPAGIVLAPGANTTVQVTYSPSDEGTDSGTLEIDSDDADEPTVTVSLSGNGVPVPVPEIVVDPLSLNYGDVFIGSGTPLSVTITNTGTADLDVSSIAFGAGTSADFAITAGPAIIILAPGANTTVEVTYSPSDEGTDSGTLVIDSDDADEPTVTVSLSGNGVPVPVPEIDVDPLSLNYGDVFIGSGTPLSVTISNTGTADLDVSSIAFGAGTSADFAITAGPANTVLVPGANTTVEVTYSPSDEGSDSGTLEIVSDDADEPTVTVSLSGNGVAVPVPEIDVTPLSLNYGDVFIGSDSSLTVTITNTGTADLDVFSIAFGAGTSADFAITAGPASIILAPGANTPVEVTYSPSDVGTDSGTLVIDSNDSDEPTVTVSLSGNGVAVPVPEIDVTPLSLNYGDVFISSSSPLSVTITNTGTADLDVSSIAFGAGTSADFAITAGPTNTVLVPGANTTVEVTYSPLDEGTDSGTLEIVNDDADEPTVTVSLSGNGVPVTVPEIDVSPLSLNYGDVFIGAGTPLLVTITNMGTADLDVSSIDFGAGTSADFAITAGLTNIVLVPGANTSVEVTYSPSDAGTDSGTLVIDSDDFDEPRVTVSMSGNGVPVPVPEIDVTPISLNYGDVFIGSSTPLSVTISNIGSADLDVSSIALGSGTSADFAITAGPTNVVLVPGSNTTVEVTYSPSDEGTDSGTLEIDSDDADEPTVTVSLSGNGVPVPVPEIDVTPLSLNYGDVFIGSGTPLSVTITNTGTADLDVSSIAFGAGTSADFSITSGPASIILAPGANTPVEVTYSPSDAGTDSGTLVIESDDADEPTVTVSLSGNGVEVPVPEIDVTPLSLSLNYGDVFIGSDSSLTVTITNTGTADLDVSSIALGAGTSADFAITAGPSNIVLVPGANIAVQITYSPSDAGGDSGTLEIVSDDTDEPTVIVSLSGNGVAVPVPEIDVTPLSLNYGDVFIGSGTPLSVTITNTGTADLDVSSIAFGAGTSADFAITAGPTNIVLVPGANTTVEVTYSPSDSGSDSGTLEIVNDDADEPTVTVSLSGNGVLVPVPEIDVSPLSLNYGDVFISSSSPLSVTITNTGTADLDVSSIAFGTGTSADFAITAGLTNIVLVPGANTTVEVTYSPSDEGTDSGTLEIVSDDADEPTVIVSLSGNGVPVPVPEIDVTPLSLNYGDVFIGSGTPLSVTITNTGTADLDVSSIAFGAGTSADFAITAGPAGIVLAPGANTTVQITYSPSDEGTDSGTLEIDSDDADEPTVTVSLSGNGVPVPVPEIDVTPLSLNYGDVFIGSGTPLSVTITNTGTADLDVSSIALGAGTSADFAISSGPSSIVLAPGANTTVQVTYSPSDEGTDSGTLEIVSDDADEPTVTVSLSGNGVLVPVPEIDVNPLSLNYGDVFIGTGTPLSVTIANTGSADLDVSNIAFGAGTSADFAITAGPASIILAPGDNTTVEVTYSPSDAGADSGTLEIVSDDADEPTVTVSLFGNGVESPEDTIPPLCELSAINTGPPVSIEVTAQDDESGLDQINILSADNVDVFIPLFDQGTNDPVIISAEKIEQNQSSRVQLEVFDVAGNVTVCDPVITLVIRETGKPVSETHTNISYDESFVTVYNGDPGVKNLDIIVNGTKFKVTALGDGKETTIDVLSAMLPGDNNTITLTARGKPGGSALVVIHD